MLKKNILGAVAGITAVLAFGSLCAGVTSPTGPEPKNATEFSSASEKEEMMKLQSRKSGLLDLESRTGPAGRTPEAQVC